MEQKLHARNVRDELLRKIFMQFPCEKITSPSLDSSPISKNNVHFFTNMINAGTELGLDDDQIIDTITLSLLVTMFNSLVSFNNLISLLKKNRFITRNKSITKFKVRRW